MNYQGKGYVERRLSHYRRALSDRRSGIERRSTSTNYINNNGVKRIANERRNTDRRSEDRRKHCMHCGMTYTAGPASNKVCVCRANALRGAADIL